VRSLQEGWAQVEPPSPGAPPAIIDRSPRCQQHASVGGVTPYRRLGAHREHSEACCQLMGIDRHFGARGVRSSGASKPAT
jgi:hypothetical protein